MEDSLLKVSAPNALPAEKANVELWLSVRSSGFTSSVGATFLLARASLLSVVRDDYVLVARAKGLRERTIAFRHALPDTRVFYAVKANPEPAVIRRLVACGSRFDAASRALEAELGRTTIADALAEVEAREESRAGERRSG